MKKNLAIISMMLLLLTATIFVTLGHLLWAKVLGVLFLILFLFVFWKRKSRGLSTFVYSLSVIGFVWTILWLHPAGAVNDMTIFLLTAFVIVSSLWEHYKEFRWQDKEES
ncbi:MAG: hypothetical protein GY832_05415 [Chloroflexi bacterium]|nr:hypothetical protein [Chloroflexota bacterium]